MARLLPVPKLANLKLAQLCLHCIAVTSVATIVQTYPPVNSVTQPCLLADDFRAVLGAVWVASTHRSPGKTFFFPWENLTVQHKMRFYWVETSRIETVGSHRVAARAREQPVSQPACLHNWDLMVCSEEGQGSGEQPGSPALSRRCGQEETTGGAWAELVLRCMVPRAEANA